MTYTSNTVMLVEEEIAGNMSNKHNSKIQDKKVWRSLRTHILSRREKNKQAEVDAEVLRKKKCVEYQKMQENKLSLAQINGRLSQLRDKRDELEEEKRVLLSQTQTTDDLVATALVVPKIEPDCEHVNSILITTNNAINASNNAISNQRPTNLHIFKQQNTVNAQFGLGSPAAGGSRLSPLAQHSFMMHNSITSNTGGINQTLLVCSPATINAIAVNNQNINLPRTMSLSASLTTTMVHYNPSVPCSVTHLSAPNAGVRIKMNRSPPIPSLSIQQQNFQQQQIVAPFSAYKSMNSGSSNSNNLNSTVTAPAVNNLNQTLGIGINSNYSTENSNRRGNREDAQSFNRNVWINNNANKNALPNVGNYGSFYQPPTTAVNYRINNGMTSSSASSLTVNTVYSSMYSGQLPPPPPPPPPPPRTESSSSGNSTGEHGQQTPRPISSHQPYPNLHQAPSHPPMYMSPGIRNQTSNHAYHSKLPHNIYADVKLGTPSNFYQHQGSRHSSTITVPSHPHHMSHKSHNIGYPLRHPSAPPPVSQIAPIIHSTLHASYNVPTCSVAAYPIKSSAAVVSTADIPRFQLLSQTTVSKHE